MCKEWIEKLYTKYLDKQVEKYWNIYHFDMTPGHQSHNNEGDAFKHCYMSAELDLLLGYERAKKITDAHEDWPGNPEAEKNMDLHNNSMGFLIAAGIKMKNKFWPFTAWRDKIADRVMENMKAGNLITHI